jgi:catechol 2,3-dioxygenase-like lactoylglutathione lyase family enzyme
VAQGIPGMRGTDHIGFTVPDLDEAERFLVAVLGAEPIYTLGAKQSDDDWMAVRIGVDPRTVIREIRFYRLGNGSNLEVFQYEPGGADLPQRPQPRNGDIGGHHLGAHDVEILGEPTASAGAALGQRWLYFRSPWGMQFELVSFPGGKAYERDAARRLWHPARPAE